MEEKLKAREKVLKPVENHQSQLANVVAKEEDFKTRKKLDEITNEIFALMLLHLQLTKFAVVVLKLNSHNLKRY